MKKTLSLLAASALAISALIPSTSASAQVATGGTVTVDENGNGTITGGGTPAITLTSGVGHDPGPGGLNNVLFYNLVSGYSAVAGDVYLQDLISDQLVTLDVIRFNPGPPGELPLPGTIFFYSDNIDGVDNLGDTPGPPGGAYENTVTLRETGIEGVGDGAFYTPTAGQPGYITGKSITYLFVSDSAVPEPATWAMMLLGFGAIGLAVRRRPTRALALS